MNNDEKRRLWKSARQLAKRLADVFHAQPESIQVAIITTTGTIICAVIGAIAMLAVATLFGSSAGI